MTGEEKYDNNYRKQRILADFVQEGAVPQPLLANLASPGYFFDDLTLDYTLNLKVFCGCQFIVPSAFIEWTHCSELFLSLFDWLDSWRKEAYS